MSPLILIPRPQCSHLDHRSKFYTPVSGPAIGGQEPSQSDSEDLCVVASYILPGQGSLSREAQPVSAHHLRPVDQTAKGGHATCNAR